MITSFRAQDSRPALLLLRHRLHCEAGQKLAVNVTTTAPPPPYVADDSLYSLSLHGPASAPTVPLPPSAPTVLSSAVALHYVAPAVAGAALMWIVANNLAQHSSSGRHIILPRPARARTTTGRQKIVVSQQAVRSAEPRRQARRAEFSHLKSPLPGFVYNRTPGVAGCATWPTTTCCHLAVKRLLSDANIVKRPSL
ncbi:hypothetical protein KSP40_PGU014575 [Platanthera guangdongensis]|uniref:Uncharacterized protein n=1 Tax=Platanthera guangdongensis TaxID=2320717 RepID=A0ABR2LI07_9ASPA